ncbi:MAG: hypothetical protein ACYS5V_16725 [Planctomycetota bacterium]|jgi:hypothetical protein
MTFRAGFAQVDVTPAPGVEKIGWLKVIVSDHVADPLFARAAVFESGDRRAGLIQLDMLFSPAAMVAEIRRRISDECEFPGQNVMVCATHNHAGPAIDDVGMVRCDRAYVAELIDRVVGVFGQALSGLRPAEAGFGRSVAFGVGHNRRVVMRDGTVRTHGRFSDPDALYVEGPIDPEVAVVAFRSAGDGEPLAALVNFACHPAHHGPDGALSAGFPGVLAAEMSRHGWPVTCFLQGASGNIACADPATGGETPMEDAGQVLARAVDAALAGIEFAGDVPVGCRSRTVRLPFRQVTADEIRGAARGAQRFIDSAIYDRAIPALLERIRRDSSQPAEVQVLHIGETALVALGGEVFVEIALAIKQRGHPARVLVVTCANDRLGYIPTAEAFERGGPRAGWPPRPATCSPTPPST